MLLPNALHPQADSDLDVSGWSGEGRVHLLPFQREAVNRILERNFLLADDCGLGKTHVAIRAVANSCTRGPILTVCPKSVKGWWLQQIRREGIGQNVVVSGTGGRFPDDVIFRPLPVGQAPMWLITHPAGVRLNLDLKDIIWSWVIVDEAHRFKNRKAKQTYRLNRIPCRGRRLAMTATPYGNNPSDLWSLIHWLYPKGAFETPDHQKKYFTSFWQFYEEFVDYEKNPWQKFRFVKGGKHLDRLAEMIAPFTLQRDKSHLDLPPMTPVNVPVPLDPWQEKMYRKLARQSYLELLGKEVILKNVLVKILRLQQCALDPALMVKGSSSAVAPCAKSAKLKGVPTKVKWLKDWMEDHTDEPVILVSRFRSFVEKWGHLFDMPSITGRHSEQQRAEALEEFERTGRLFGTLKCVCEGLNLQRSYQIVVVDGTWSAIDAYQLSQRIHRIGQTHPCFVYYLQATLGSRVGGGRRKGTVDHLISRAVHRKLTEAQLVQSFLEGLKL